MSQIKCPHCQGEVEANMEKIGTVIGGGVAITIIAAFFGLGGGWLALGAATLGGSSIAKILLRAKMQLLKHSQQLGGFFVCTQCKRNVPVGEAFKQIFHNFNIDD